MQTASDPTPVRRILVIQLERLGDAIQSSPLLEDLLRVHPEATIDFWTIDLWVPALKGMPRVNVRGVSSPVVSALNQEVRVAVDEGRVPPQAAKAVEGVTPLPYDLVINLTHSPFAAFWSSKVRAPVRLGPHLSARAETLYAGVAFRYLVASVGLRDQTWMNLVDVYRAACPLGGVPPRSARPYIAADEMRGLPFSGRYVLLNPGASAAVRQWPPAFFAALARELLGRGVVPVVVGTKGERELCAGVCDAAGEGAFDLSGKTSIPELAWLSGRAALVVTNDTGTAHVASAAGGKVLGLYGGPARFNETAPWGAGHLILQAPREGAISEIPTGAAVAATIELLGEPSGLSEALAGSGVTAWETCMLTSEDDQLGGVAYRPRHSRYVAVGDIAPLALRSLLASDFRSHRGEVEMPHLRSIAPPHLGAHAAALRQDLTPIVRRLEALADVAQSAQLFIDASDNERFAEASNALMQGLEELSGTRVKGAELVLHNLDWAIRFMPILSSRETFEYGETECRRAASLLSRVCEQVAKMAG